MLIIKFTFWLCWCCCNVVFFLFKFWTLNFNSIVMVNVCACVYSSVINYREPNINSQWITFGILLQPSVSFILTYFISLMYKAIHQCNGKTVQKNMKKKCQRYVLRLHTKLYCIVCYTYLYSYIICNYEFFDLYLWSIILINWPNNQNRICHIFLFLANLIMCR